MISLGVFGDSLDRLLGMEGESLVEPLSPAEDLPGMDLDIGCLTLKYTKGLMDQHAGVGQCPSLALGSACQEHGAHRRGLPDADGGHVAADVVHGVIDGHAGSDDASRAVDVEEDVFLGVLTLEVEELGHDQVGNLIVDGNVAEVMRKARSRIVLNVRVKDRSEEAARSVEQCNSVDSVDVTEDQMLAITLKPDIEDYSDIPSTLVGQGFALMLFREEEVNLETAFLELTKGLVQ